MSTVVCVLKSGGHYTPEWAWKLKAGVEQYLPGADFRCLTDMEGVPGAVPLLKDRPGWWSLPEWYRPLFEGRVIALGLDTLIVGDLSELAAYDGPLAGIDDLYRPRHLASGVMTWRGDEAAHLWEAFESKPGTSWRTSVATTCGCAPSRPTPSGSRTTSAASTRTRRIAGAGCRKTR